MSAAPFYGLSREYVARNGELEQYKDSMKQNIACARALEKAIDEVHPKLWKDSIRNIAIWHNIVRLGWVTAISMLVSDSKHFSQINKLWASIYTPPPEPECGKMLIRADPVDLNSFASVVRREYGCSFFPEYKEILESYAAKQSDGMVMTL